MDELLELFFMGLLVYFNNVLVNKDLGWEIGSMIG